MAIFPLPQPAEEDIEALEREWSRQDLERYLWRWRSSKIAPIPPGFFDFDWRACDVGCGFGKYILAQSEAFPQRAYLGIDKGALRGGKMLDRLGRQARPNLFGMNANAIPVLATMPDGALDQITIFYPNPWWPKKHRKKRWACHPLLPNLIRLLKPGGQLLVTSNEAFYLGELVYAMAHHPDLDKTDLVYARLVALAPGEGRTHFETKFLEEGVACGELLFKKQ